MRPGIRCISSSTGSWITSGHIIARSRAHGCKARSKVISKLLGISAAFLGLVSAAEPAQLSTQLATMVCGSCHTLEIVKKRQAAKNLTESVCTLCHEFTRVERQKLSST